MDTRRNVQREDGRRVLIDCRYGLRILAADVALQAAAQYRVDQQTGLCIELSSPGRYHTPFRNEIAISGRGVAFQGARIHKRQNRYADAFVRGEARNNVAVAAIIACTTDDLPTPGVGEALSRCPQRRCSGPRHQGITGDTVVFDGGPIDFTH